MPSSPSPRAGQRAGYIIAAAVLIGIWFAITVWPGWQNVGFLSEDFGRVVGLVHVSLLAGIVANLLYARWDPVWLKAIGGLVVDGISLAVVVALWRGFPFTFPDGSEWHWITRAVLVIAMVGTAIDMLVQIGTLLRAAVTSGTLGRSRR